MTQIATISAETQREMAIAEVVRKHLGWVYGVARRNVTTSDLAEDIAQSVFVLLVKKRPTFTDERALVSWLHRATINVSRNVARREMRLKRRETEAAMRQDAADRSLSQEWAGLSIMIDELVGKLSQDEREAILLRFYRQMSFAEVGSVLGTTEEAARKRVTRAIDKLRDLAAGKGSHLSATAITSYLSEQLIPQLPSGLIGMTTTSAIGGSTAPAAGTISPVVQAAMKPSYGWIAVVAVIALLIVSFAVIVATTHPNNQSANSVASASSPATLPAMVVPKDLKVGVLISKAAAEDRIETGPSGFGRQTRILNEMRDAPFELIPIIDPGTADDPEVKATCEQFFRGKSPIDGSNADELGKLDVIIASHQMTVLPEVLDAIEKAVRNGTGFLVRMYFGNHHPGPRDQQVADLTGLVADTVEYARAPDIECQVVTEHSLVGGMGPSLGHLTLSPNGMYGRHTGTSLIEVIDRSAVPGADGNNYPISLLYTATLGKGTIIVCPFAGSKPIPRVLERAAPLSFNTRSVIWLAEQKRPSK